MESTYSRKELILHVTTYFRSKGFQTEEYSLRWKGEVRIPLYCHKNVEESDGTDREDEIVIDIISDVSISKDQYMPSISVDSMDLDDACPPIFFQYYLPRAKVFWAYNATVLHDENYDKFAAACKKNGIGLIEVSHGQVKIIHEAQSLLEQLKKDALEQLYKALFTKERKAPPLIKPSKSKESTVNDIVSKINDAFCEQYIARLIYYGDPIFRRREIANRDHRNISLLLVDRLLELHNLSYRDHLITLADSAHSSSYRKATKDDYDIAFDMIQLLWKSQLHTEYPDVQKNFEAVLQLNPRYRDHFLHEFQVFLLGAIIIDSLYDTTPIQSFNKKAHCKIEDCWLAAATYHDFNYPIQQSAEWMNDFFKQCLNSKESMPIILDLDKLLVRNEFLAKLKGICSALDYELDDYMVRFIIEKAGIERNHGVVAALSLIDRLKESGLSQYAINHTSLSILMHDESAWKIFCGNSDPNKPWEKSVMQNCSLSNLMFEKLPLTFLLAYCDAAQEWGRVGCKYDISKPELEKLSVSQTQLLVTLSLKDETYNDKHAEIEKLSHFLKDSRFGIAIQSKRRNETIWMEGEERLSV